MMKSSEAFEKHFIAGEELLSTTTIDVTTYNNKKTRETLLISNMKLCIMFNENEYYIIEHSNILNCYYIETETIVSSESESEDQGPLPEVASDRKPDDKPESGDK